MNLKKLLEIIFGLTLGSLFWVSCNTSQPAPASTSVPPTPTLTLIPSTETPLPEISAEYQRLPLTTIGDESGRTVGSIGIIAVPTQIGVTGNTTAGFLILTDEKTLDMGFVDSAANMFIIVTVTGTIEWDELSRIRSGSQNFLSIKIESERPLAIVDRKFKNGLLVLIDENGTKYMITQLSHQPNGPRTFELLSEATPTP